MLEQLKIRAYRLLRATERYTKTDMVYLARGGSWMFAGQVLQAALGFGLAIAFANLIGREEYGNYKYILSLASVLGAFSLAGLGTFVTQSVGRGLEGSLRYSSRLTLIWSLPAIVVALAGSAYYALAGNSLLSLSLIIIALATPLINSAQVYSSFLAGKRDFRLASFCNVSISFFQATCLALALLLHASLLALVFTYFAANAIATIACYFLILKLYHPNDLLNKAMAHFSIKLSIAGVAAIAVGQLDKILIFHFVGAAPVAVYALAQAPVIQMRALLKLSTPLSLPKLAAVDRQTIAKTLGGKITRFTLVIGLMVGVYILAAPFLFRLAFPQYLDAIPYSQAFALILLFFPKKLLSMTMYAQEEMRGQYALTLSTPTAQVILLLALVPFIGIWGAIIAEIGANFAANTLANYYFRGFKRGT